MDVTRSKSSGLTSASTSGRTVKSVGDISLPFKPNGSLTFEGSHLVVHSTGRGDLPAFDLDLHFDSVGRHWTGIWPLCNKSGQVVLERPHNDSTLPSNDFVGDWEESTESRADRRSRYGSLHIRCGRDGTIMAWIDRSMPFYDPHIGTTRTDQRNGEELRVVSLTQARIVLETVNPTGRSQYEGTLAGNRNELKGKWLNHGVGTLNAPASFRRVTSIKYSVKRHSGPNSASSGQ